MELHPAHPAVDHRPHRRARGLDLGASGSRRARHRHEADDSVAAVDRLLDLDAIGLERARPVSPRVPEAIEPVELELGRDVVGPDHHDLEVGLRELHEHPAGPGVRLGIVERAYHVLCGQRGLDLLHYANRLGRHAADYP
jgi:hypothetical protein